MDLVRAVYSVACAAAEIERVARAIAVEQTVEVPEALIRDEADVGVVAAIEPRGARFAVTIDYAARLAHGQLPQLLNLVFGNVSIHGHVRLIDLQLPESLLARFPGPRFGVAGLRALLDVAERPLLSTALKPRGLAGAAFAGMAAAFARGGGDLVKDDHNVVDDDLPAFAERVGRIRDAVGDRCLYVPNLCAPADELPAYLDCVARLGIRGVMVAPLVAGLDTVRALAAAHELVVVAHPTFGGAYYGHAAHGMEAALLLGTLLRLAGVDVSVFTNHGGRFALTRDDCHGIARRLREPLGALRRGWPAPAGGMRFENVDDLVAEYGPDTMLLVGGDLLARGSDLERATAEFRARL